MKPTFTFKNKPYQALLFDMDGTLIDNMMIHHEAWRVALDKYGIHMTLAEVKAEIHGVNHEILARLFGDTFTEEEAKQFSYNKELAYRRIYKAQIELISGAKQFLDKAHSLAIPMGLATAAPLENVDFVFENLPIADYFSAVKHAGDVSRGKPDPQVFCMTAEAVDADIAQCLIFEDSVTGALAAKNAGADAVVITSTHSEEEFSEITNVVAFAQNYDTLLSSLALPTGCER